MLKLITLENVVTGPRRVLAKVVKKKKRSTDSWKVMQVMDGDWTSFVPQQLHLPNGFVD